MNAFELTSHDLGELALRPLLTENAKELGEALAAIQPWSVIGYPAERLADWLRRQEPTMRKFEAVTGQGLTGVIVIQDPFLHGPYLKLIAILPGFQGRSLGMRLLQWMELEARHAEDRQLWLCVSTFNSRARALRTIRFRSRRDPGQARVRRLRRASDAEAPFLRCSNR